MSAPRRGEDEPIRARAAFPVVDPDPSVQNVGPGSTSQRVVAQPAVQLVTAAPADQDVFAALSGQPVVASGAVQQVVLVVSGQDVVSRSADAGLRGAGQLQGRGIRRHDIGFGRTAKKPGRSGMIHAAVDQRSGLQIGGQQAVHPPRHRFHPGIGIAVFVDEAIPSGAEPDVEGAVKDGVEGIFSEELCSASAAPQQVEAGFHAVLVIAMRGHESRVGGCADKVGLAIGLGLGDAPVVGGRGGTWH